jgi:HlyD family secretion protein
VVSAPVSGRILRIELEPGDAVRLGDVVARIQPEAPALLDTRALAEAQAAVEGADAALGRARADEQRLRAALAQAEREVERSRRLVAGGAMPAKEADARADDARLAADAVQAAEYSVAAAAAELGRARARLGRPPAAPSAGIVAVTAPVNGVVLRRLRESESVVPVGEALLELGNPSQLDVVADLLSTDAVRVAVGARAMIEQWGQDRILGASVRRVEPAGFTKVSALGVEEQRVNVILDPSEPSEWLELGDAYRVDVRIVVWEAGSVLKVPTSALFRDGESWAVYTVDSDRARLTRVTLGHQTASEAEVTAGLVEDTEVIVHPGDLVRDGVRVRRLASS